MREGSLAHAPLYLTIRAPIEERELGTLELEKTSEMSLAPPPSPAPPFHRRGNCDVHTGSGLWPKDLALTQQSKVNYSFLRLRLAGLPQPFLTVRPWPSHFSSLNLSVLICKMGDFISNSQGC